MNGSSSDGRRIEGPLPRRQGRHWIKLLDKRWRHLKLSVRRDSNRPRTIRDCRLVMTLLVRDEEEILEANLDFHYARGVDFVIAMDNGSVDRSHEILRRYEDEGRLRVLCEPNHTFEQQAWVNRMAAIAVADHGADLLFHCDADEFWHPTTGNLKDELLARRRVDALAVPVRNVLLRDRGGLESFPEDCVYAIDRPLLPASPGSDAGEPVAIYLRPHPPSVLFTTHDGPRSVRLGNHSLAKGEVARMRPAESIRIDHYPVRSRAAFERKALHASSLVENNPAADVGMHWRQWDQARRRGDIASEYQKLILSDERAEELMKSGHVTRIAPLTPNDPKGRAKAAPAVAPAVFEISPSS